MIRFNQRRQQGSRDALTRQKSVVFIYTSNTYLEDTMIEKIPLTIATKNIT